MARYKLGQTVTVQGELFKITRSPRKNKQRRAINLKKGYYVDYGDPNMPEYPGTKRGKNYCTRSKGIGNLSNLRSANFWSRYDLWKC